MVHVSVGTANARVRGHSTRPGTTCRCLVTAGRTPIARTRARLGARDTQHPLGPGDVRPGRHAARAGEVGLRAARRRARSTRSSTGRWPWPPPSPRGPVYLALPRELLAEDLPFGARARGRRDRGAGRPPARPRPRSRRLADRLARRPVPRDPHVGLGHGPGQRRAAGRPLRPIRHRRRRGRSSLPQRPAGPRPAPRHPDPAALSPRRRPRGPTAADVPWMATRSSPRDETFVAQTGVDPLFARYPIRTHRSRPDHRRRPHRAAGRGRSTPWRSGGSTSTPPGGSGSPSGRQPPGR